MHNAALEAFLYLAGFPFPIPLDVSHYEWRQYMDHRGRPRSKVRAGRWHFVTSRLTQAQYEQLLALMLSHTAVVDAHATYSRADGQGVFVTVWGRRCTVCHVEEHFDSRGTNGQEPGWVLYFTLAAEEMGREAGTGGEFVMPAPGEYAYNGVPASVAGPVAAADAWLDDLEKQFGFEVRGNVKSWVAGGLDEKKLKSAIRSVPDSKLVYERLVKAETEKGIYQQRVVIDDYDNIPGVVREPYMSNRVIAPNV